MPELSPPGRSGDLTELQRACLVALRVPNEQAAASRPRPAPLWRVSDAILRIRQLIAAFDGSSLAAFLPTIGGEDPARLLHCRAAIASTLVAGLELKRDGALALEQDAAWTPIWVRHRDDCDAGAVDDAALVVAEPPA